MNNKIKIFFIIVNMSLFGICCESVKQHDNSTTTETPSKKMVIHIILGTTRQGRTSDKIGLALKRFADKRTDVVTEIIDIRDYDLPFLRDEIPPAARERINDPMIKKWSDKITAANAFIVIVPEYNAGYPGVLKNALDSLYKEWNNKPIAFVGYSGGASGGTNAIAQLHTVAKAFKMIPVACEITIPNAWKAFDETGGFANKNIEQEFNRMIDQLINGQTNH